MAGMELGAREIMAISILVLSLGLMGAGYFYKKKNSRHLLILAGELFFGLYWLTYIPAFWEKGDMFNLLFCALALPFFGFFAYHEYLCYKRKEELKPLNWIAGTAFFAAGIYFSLSYVPFLHWALVYVVAFKSAAVATLFGYSADIVLYTRPWEFVDHRILITHNGSGNISIVLACTGVQAIALFAGFILSTKPDRSIWKDWANVNLKLVEKKIDKASGLTLLRLRLIKRTLTNLLWRTDRQRVFLAFCYTVPVIYLTNLLRNASLVYVVYENKLNFDFAHNYVTKGLALALMLFMLLVLFEVLPELQENVLGLMDVFRYRKKGNVKDGFVELEFD